MSTITEEHITLMPKERDIIIQGEWLTDVHMDHFQQLLRSCSDYRPVETWRIQLPDTIQPVSKETKHIQILHSSSGSFDGHWVCSFYDRKKIFIYDSLNNKTLHKQHKKFLERLFPTYDFEKNDVQFPTVQHQPNSSDCGVFAIAFAISLLFNIKPEKVRYEDRLMRLHLLKIFETNVIEHFPQNAQYGVPQKVLPLAVIRAREIKALVTRVERRNETEQQKLSRLKKLRDTYLCKKNSSEKEFCAKKRLRYAQNAENNRAKQHRYKEKKRLHKRISYLKHSQHERTRKAKYSDRKLIYNKRCYEKNKLKRSLVKQNICQKIIRKYDKFRSENCIQMHNPVTIDDIMKKLDINNEMEKRLEAEKMLRWSMDIRNNYISEMYKIFTKLKKNAEVHLTLVNSSTDLTIDDKVRALCGMSNHTASSESYFADTYRKLTSSQSLVMNAEGQVTNVLPLRGTKKVWSCTTLCKIDSVTIDRYQKVLEAISTCTSKKIPQLLHKLNQKCTLNNTTEKKGHTNNCYINPTVCTAMSLPIQLLSPHFPKVRNIKRFIYKITCFYRDMINLEEALISTDVGRLNEIIKLAQEQAKMYKYHHACSDLSDDEIILKYKKAFKALTKRSIDTPRYVCVSCERLCYKKNVSEISKVDAEIDIPIWRKLMAYIEKNQNTDPQYICSYCERKFRNGLMPAYCVLNNLIVEDVPDVILSLNTFEKILIQRAKAFQTVVKMGTVMNKKLPHRQMVPKVRGRTFHLPLPLQETWNKICSNTDPINTNLEMYILIRGVPTKSKIVWEEMVNVEKVFHALTWLKHNNPHYRHIILPETHEGLRLQPQFFEVQEEENDHSQNVDDPSRNPQMEEIKNKVKSNLTQTNHQCEAMLTATNNQHQAMLTQIIDADDSDHQYEQYTIYPLYEKKSRESACALYQMLKIQDIPLDEREKCLDVLCFPDLYPYGVNGQHETRQIKLHDHEFIKCRLTSKHPRYRVHQQYLFFLLNNANNRQLKRGIYHKMKISDRYTAFEYLKAIENEILESDLSTIFATLRNTDQYWRIPRNNLNCMTQHYGPATWFLTLSPSEWMWDDLGQYIREVNGWCNDSSCTSVLVARDPVSTSRFLENKFRAMLDFICSTDDPIGKVAHYFWRREYQGRGIQHFHLLIWIKNAPIIGESSEEEISKFILKYVTCKMPDKKISPLLYKRVDMYQKHRHNDYCLRCKKMGRKTGRVCRFGFPRTVTETLILRDVISSIAGRKQLKNRSRLYDLPRKDNEVDINDYNPILLTAWEGNMDIQYIGDLSRLLTSYVTKYINKAAKCELSESIFDSKNRKNKSVASCLWNVAQRFMNHRECGALEAADTLLSIPLYGTDLNTTIKWINVDPIRRRRVKSKAEVKALDEKSTDIFYPSIIDDHYPHRPEEFELMSLYEFAQWYDITKAKPQVKYIQCYKMHNGYYLKKRQRAHLINHFKYDVKTQPENYFYSLLLLFKPWWKIEELKNGYDTYAESFHEANLVEALQYHEKMEEIKEAYETVKQLLQQQLDEKQDVSQDDPDNPIGIENIQAGEAMQDFKDLGKKGNPEIDISEMISQLNVDQKRVFDRVINTVRTDKSLLRLYISGEGGTGKSFLIKTIKCWIKQNLNKNTAIAAPTGIAAFNIDGLTVHRLLQLPVEHGHSSQYKALADHVLKVLRADLKDVVLIIIDEVSMISNITLLYIHLRLCEIFDTTDFSPK